MSRRRRIALLTGAGAVAALAAVSLWPVGTRAGVNYVVTERRIPLWRKATDFVARDRATRRLAERIVRPEMSDEQRALTILNWTNERIRAHPDTVPVLDDHVWSIVERGYGSNDQQADVFTTLLTYAGVPAYWILIGPNRPVYPISLALIDGRWRVFDAERAVAFRNAAGALATADELASSPELIRQSAADRVADLDGYVGWFSGFRPPLPPRPLRAELQMPGKRLVHEARRLLRLTD